MKTKLLLAVLFGLVFAASAGSPAMASDTAARLQMAVKRMSAWLGADENATRWRQALLLNILESQAAKGDLADFETLNRVLQRFESDLPGIEHPAFEDVRRALRNHANHIAVSQYLDIEAYLADNPNDRYRAVEPGEIDAYRQEALYFLQMFKSRYESQRPAEETGPLFEKLKLDETLTLLGELDIASIMPPASAAGANAEPNEDEAAEPPQEPDQDRQRERANVLRALITATRAFEDDQTNYLDVHFGSARLTLDRFVRLLAYATDPSIRSTIEKQMEVIITHYPQLGDPNARSSAAMVGDALGYLESSLQHRTLVTAIRRQFSLPNAMVQIHPNLFAEQTSRANSEIRPVSEIILGRLILGDAYTHTFAGLELLNDPDQVAASIRVQGSIDSSTYTKQGPITAFAGSNGQFEGRRNVYGNVGGFYDYPPYVAANLQSYFKNVNINLNFVQRIANKQFQRDKVRSEGIAAARAEDRIQMEFREQTDEVLNQGRERLSESFGKLDDYRTAIPPVYAFSQTDRIEAHAHKVDPFHLAATVAPQPPRVPADVHVRLHESMLINYVDPLFVGKTLTNTEIADKAKEILGETPAAFSTQEAEGDEPWSITFARIQPFRFELEDNRIRIGIVGERFTQGNNTIRSGMIIRLAYRIAERDGKLYLVRDGDATVDYADPTDQNARAISFKTFLEKKLNTPPKAQPQDETDGNGLMPDPNPNKLRLVKDGDFEGLELPDNLLPVDQVEALQEAELIRKLRLVEFRIENGWLYVGWNRIPSYPVMMLTDLAGIHKLDTPAPSTEESDSDESNAGSEPGPEAADDNGGAP